MASNSALTSMNSGKKGFFARFQRFLSFPMRFLIFRPWKIISQILSRSKDIDGATAKIEKEIIVNDSTVSTSVIDELNDVSMVTSVVKETSSPLQIVSGDIFTDAAIASNSPTVATKGGATRTQPVGERWAIAGNGVDLSGKYRVIVTEEFKKAYDEYLASLGQPLIVRTVALGIIGRTTEELSMTEKGKYLLIRGTNARGIWDRTLVASGTEIGVDDFDPLLVPVMTADSEKVEAESWWEADGTIHVSWLRGVSRYGGGSFKSKRYLEDNGETYVCESTFYFDDESKKKSKLIWRFRREK